jgi:hypothetical protein
MDDKAISEYLDERKKQKLLKRIIQSNKPTLSFSITSVKRLVITYSNLQAIKIKLYLIDLEILFSKMPFTRKDHFDFSYILPAYSETIQVEKSKNLNIIQYDIPEKFSTKDLIVEAVSDSDSDSVKHFETFYSNAMKVIISESLGELKVTDSDNKPLQGVYVKCFAKKKNDDKVVFYKDGYTDLRGRFNYFSLNTENIKGNKKFSIFVKDENLGSLIREVDPPLNILDGDIGGYEEFETMKREIERTIRRR